MVTQDFARRQGGRSVVTVAHDHDVLELCDRVLGMVDGTLSPYAA
jgi:ABC-type lipoprotein export system ATPase subunit